MVNKRRIGRINTAVSRNTAPSMFLGGKLAGSSGRNSPTQAQRDRLVALFSTGRHAELESLARSLLAQFPASGFVWKVLGVALRGQGKEALPALQKAIEFAPDDADAHNNLGNALKELGQPVAAVASYRRALALHPDFAEAHRNLGNALTDLGQFEEAAEACLRAVALKPEFTMAHCNLGNAMKGLGQLDAAVASYRRALAIAPDHAISHTNLGCVLAELGQLDAALESQRRAVAIAPDYAMAHSNLGSVLAELGRTDEALASCRRALALKPDFADAHQNLAQALQKMGCLEAAIQSFRRALLLRPDCPLIHGGLLFALLHSETCSTQALLAEHVRFGERFEQPLRPAWPHWEPQKCAPALRDPERRLRLGFVSGDLHSHPVSFFMLPVWRALDRRRFELVAYYNYTREDDLTKSMRSASDQWFSVAHLSDQALAAKIGADQIDILIDLSGHTARNRLLTFARKPAPVQASWLGYPGTTGLAAMDYFLVNRYAAPAGQLDAQFVEKILGLPLALPFASPSHSPPVNDLPALRNGFITFGSFNRVGKLGDACLALWSEVLLALPDSRLLLGNIGDAEVRQSICARFAALGIAAARLRFHPAAPLLEYLALHHEVDIVLDSFPYGGGTTSRFALWMGVPVLALIGARLPQRQSVGVIKSLGMEAWCVADREAFVAQAQRAADDLPALAVLRGGMRQKLEHGPMSRPEAMTRGLEQVLRRVWRRWCEGLPPQAMEVASI